MKKLMVLLLLVFVISFSAFSQNLDTVTYRHGLGFAAGRTTGIGLAYLYQPKDLGVQLVLGAYEENINLGVTPMYMLGRDEMLNLFLYSGNSVFYGDLYYGANPDKNWLFSNGFGIGLEAHQKQFSFNLMAGIASYTWLKDEWTYGFTVDASLFYRLK